MRRLPPPAWARSSVVEHTLHTGGVAGSIPAAPTTPCRGLLQPPTDRGASSSRHARRRESGAPQPAAASRFCSRPVKRPGIRGGRFARRPHLLCPPRRRAARPRRTRRGRRYPPPPPRARRPARRERPRRLARPAALLDAIPARPLCAARIARVATIAQLVRAPVCGTGGRGFKSRWSPHFPCFSGSYDGLAVGFSRFRRA